MKNPFRYFNSSPEVMRLAVMTYIRYPLSLRQVEDILFERGIDICHETVPHRPRDDGGGLRGGVPASPIQLEATGAHDRNPVATRLHPPPMAGPAVCHQSPEVGAGWFSDHVRICAGGAQQCAFLPQLRAPPGNRRPYRDTKPSRQEHEIREGRRFDRTKAVLTHPLERVQLLGVTARSKFYSHGATP